MQAPKALRGIRGRLVMLVAAALFPVLLFAVAGVAALADRERHGIETGLRDTARSVALGVEKELDSSVTALQALTTSASLRAGDDGLFREQLAKVRREARTPWLTAAAVDGSGRVLVALAPPLASVFPPAATPDFFRPVFSAGQPWAAHMASGSGESPHNILVAVPTRGPDNAERALVAVLGGEVLSSTILRHRLTAEASVYILDAKGEVVARVSTADPPDAPLDIDAASIRRAGWEGVSQFAAAGRPLYAAYARSPEWGWTAALIVPASTVDGSWRRWLITVIGGGTLLLLLGVALALLAARGITRAVAALARSAEALGRGEGARSVPSGIVELDEVGHAIAEAATARRANARELEVRAEQQAAIVDLGQRALRGTDIATLLDDAARTLCATLGADACHVLELDADGTHVVLRAAVGASEARIGQQVDAISAELLTGYALGQDDPVVMENLASELRFRGGAFLEAQGIVGGATAVIHGSSRPYGLLGVYTQVVRGFTRDEVAFLQSIANILAAATERMRAEAERTDLLNRERNARTEAEAASRAKDEFLAMLGHELRNPLAAIASAGQVLEQSAQESADASQRRLTAIIARQARHLSRMVDDLLDVARVSSGKIALNPEPVDLRDIAERAVAAFREAGRIARHECAVSHESALVYGDPTRLEQVVWNLLDNALKYTPPGGRVSVVVASTPHVATLSVRDTGVGIAPDLLPHIFDLFVQAGRSIDRAEGGLGLGLTLVRRLVQLHGGTVVAASAGPGQGSEFTVRLPALGSPGSPAPVAAPAAAPARRILIVEDNADAREALALLLESWGHRVEQAGDGLVGLEIARARPPDVALIDVGLPGIDGYTLAQEIRAAPECAAVRLVALTGYSRSRDRERGYHAGFDTYLVKPVDPERLFEVLADGGPAASG